MKEFIYKTVSDSIKLERAKAGPVECVATRMRNSQGFSNIELCIDNHTALKIDSEAYGENYENVVRQIAELLERIADNPCKLP